MDTPLVRTYEAPPVDRREIVRYMGARELTEELESMLEECLQEAAEQLRYAVCWREFPVTVDGETVDLGFANVQSASLARNLTGCCRVILFAATVGLGLDRHITRYSRLQPVKGLMLQAIGTERVEALCDAFCEGLGKEFGLPVPPGFTISTEVCTYYYNNNKTYPVTLMADVRKAVANIEKQLGKKFGDSEGFPLLVA